MADLPRWQDTLASDRNIHAYSMWFICQTHEVQVLHQHLYQVIHAQDSWQSVSQAVESPLVKSDGKTHIIPKVVCAAAKCGRCDCRLGGYAFKWRGPWSCGKAAAAGCEGRDAEMCRLIWDTCLDGDDPCEQRAALADLCR